MRPTVGIFVNPLWLVVAAAFWIILLISVWTFVVLAFGLVGSCWLLYRGIFAWPEKPSAALDDDEIRRRRSRRMAGLPD